MKKFYLLIACSLLSFISLAGNISVTYHFEEPGIEALPGYQIISFENTWITGKTGEPALPYREIRLLLPPGEEAVGMNILLEEETLLPGTFQIYPQQPGRPLTEGHSGTFRQDREIYGSNQPYPSSPSGEYRTYFQNGHSILLSSFTPVQYIPVRGELMFYRKVTVEVVTRKTARAGEALNNLGQSTHLSGLASSVRNPEVLKDYPVKENRDEDYQVLVITPQQFTGDFNEYGMLYLVRGMKTEIAAVEDIDASMQGTDLQEKIRNYIIQEYQDHSVEYVLLGGDVEHVPYRGFYCYVESGWGYEDNDIPADLYYSALDGTWNDDGDGSWGEIGEDDLLPDVSVARWPFSTSGQLGKLLHKTGQYQDFPVTSELQRPLLAGEHLWSGPETWGGDYMDLLIGHCEDNGYTTDGIPETDDILKLYERDGSWGKWDLINAVNEGRNFIHHSGHANQTGVMKLGMSDITNQNFSQANGTDHNYTLVYTHGCLCGAFDENDCIGEAMVMIDNFAVAGAFNSRYGWFNEGQTEGPSQHLHREFVDALYDQQKNRIGATHMISKINTSTWVNAPGQHEEGALRWCFYACNILGDPALAIWTAEPVSIDVQYPEEILQGESTFAVTVSIEGEPAQDMMCVLMSGNTMMGCSATDESGQAVIQIPGGFNGEDAELVVSGYHCAPHYYPVNVLVGLPETGKDASVHIFPNPFNDHLNLTLRCDMPFEGEISAFLPDGRLIHKSSMEFQPGVNSTTLNTMHWPRGIVIVKISGVNLDWIRTVVRQ